MGMAIKKRGFGEFTAFRKPLCPYFLIILSMLMFSLFSSGCKKKNPSDTNTLAPAETNRLVDAVYQKQLKKNIGDQQQKVAERNVLLARIRRIEQEVRDQLPEGATEEDFKAACGKIPEWNALQAERQARNEGIEKQTEEMRDRIRKRIQSESKRRLELDREAAARETAAKAK